MKKAYMLLASLVVMMILSMLVLLINTSSYSPRFVKDELLFSQARILQKDAKKLGKYFLYEAWQQGRQCLEFVEFNYPNKDDKIRLEYFYPLATCKDFRLVDINADANLSKDFSVILNISVLFNDNALNAKVAVNEEVYLNEQVILYPKFEAVP